MKKSPVTTVKTDQDHNLVVVAGLRIVVKTSWRPNAEVLTGYTNDQTFPKTGAVPPGPNRDLSRRTGFQRTATSKENVPDHVR